MLAKCTRCGTASITQIHKKMNENMKIGIKNFKFRSCFVLSALSHLDNSFLGSENCLLSKQDCFTHIVLWSSPVRLICNCHCTFMAVLCIGAEQIEVL